jgi:hypothetical protein
LLLIVVDLCEGRQTQQVVVHLMMYHGMTQDMAVGYMIECWINIGGK